MIYRNKGSKIVRKSFMWAGTEIHEGKRYRLGCILGGLLVIAITAAGILAWEVKEVATTEITNQKAIEAPAGAQGLELCDLDEVVCAGELSSARELWIGRLEKCESSGNPKAVNPKDTDGTPSYGAFQFKPSTFDMYSKRYGIKGELMDRNVQKQLVEKMMDDSKVRWQNEFPACVKKLGLPPL